MIRMANSKKIILAQNAAQSPCCAPLVSFCVKCYNQENFISSALDGAFSQTYRPLEIVISDDCSTDGSVKVIEGKISEYKAAGGDIPIIFSRNGKNLGNLGNWQIFGKIAHGELLVKADGDDISLPERTERCVNAWLANERKALLIQHRATVIDKEGKDLAGTIGDIGSCQCYSRELWDKFPVAADAGRDRKIYDDVVFGARAHTLAGVEAELHIPDLLVRYRFGSGDTTRASNYRAMVSRNWQGLGDSLCHVLKELDVNVGEVGADRAKAERAVLCRRIQEARANCQLLDATANFRDRLAAISTLEGVFGHKSPRDRLFHIVFLLPHWLADALLAPYFRFFYFKRAYSH